MLRTKARFGHLLRAALKLASLVAMFAALQAAPIATVTAIGFAAPLFVTLGAWLLFSEKPGVLRTTGLCPASRWSSSSSLRLSGSGKARR